MAPSLFFSLSFYITPKKSSDFHFYGFLSQQQFLHSFIMVASVHYFLCNPKRDIKYSSWFTKDCAEMIRISLYDNHTQYYNDRGLLLTTMSLAIILSTQLLTGCRAFVHPIASAPFLRAAYASSSFSSSFTSASKNTCHYNKSDRSCSSSLYSAVQQDVDRPSNTAAVAATVANGRTRVIAHDQDFLKPTLDTRNYRCIVLPNNLQVLIVSDPETDVEAAAVHIKAGHFDDPDTRAGLAHL